MTTTLFGLTLFVAIASVALLARMKGGARSVLMLVAVLAAVAMAVLLTHPHVL